jgi:hypothetical protein
MYLARVALGAGANVNTLLVKQFSGKHPVRSEGKEAISILTLQERGERRV